MECFVCKKEVNVLYLLNADGDMACSEACKKSYIKERDDFFNNINDDKWYNDYMYGSYNG